MSKIALTAVLVAGLAVPAGADHCAGHAKAKDIVSTAVEAGQFKTLAAALKATGLVATLQGDGPFTVFAPTDAAFAKLPKGTVETLLLPENRDRLAAILTYHVVAGKVDAAQVTKLSGASTVNGQRLAIQANGRSVRVGDATVVKADIDCSNGIIHVIDSVLIPTDKAIPEVAQSAGQFKTLLAAVKAAGLAETLMGDGPFTVFAPTDAAFAKLPKGTVESLLKAENRDKLTQILTYHVVPGRAYAADVLEAGKVATLQSGSLAIRAEQGKAMVQNARILATDIDATNGVIHVIDAVLIPSSEG